MNKWIKWKQLKSAKFVWKCIRNPVELEDPESWREESAKTKRWCEVS